MVNGDFSPLPENLKDASPNRKDQLVLNPSGGDRWISMNMTVKPFDDINVRKAVSAGFDRNALLLTRGGKLVGDIATHYLPPGIAGFEEAGGMKGTGVDFLSVDGKPQPELSAEYFKKAGYASGKYEGTEKILMVGSNAGVAAKTAEVAKENLERMGFKVQMRLVQQQTMYTRYCNTPSANVAVCPNVGWLKDFAGRPDDPRRRPSTARTSSSRATRTGPSSTTRRSTRRSTRPRSSRRSSAPRPGPRSTRWSRRRRPRSRGSGTRRR